METPQSKQLGPLSKLNKRNTSASKKLTVTSCQQVMTSPLFSGFLANLEQSEIWIPDR